MAALGSTQADNYGAYPTPLRCLPSVPTTPPRAPTKSIPKKFHFDEYEEWKSESEHESYDEESSERRNFSSNDLLSCNGAGVQVEKWLKSLKKPHCADCDARKGLDWVIFPWAVQVCTECARAHRKLRTKERNAGLIKNVYQDRLSEYDLERLKKLGGNKAANAKLERYLQPWRKIRPDTSRVIRERFICDKYDRTLFADVDQAMAFSSSSNEAWALVRFLEKFSDPKKVIPDYQSLTMTLNILVDEALESESVFKHSFYELFVRMGWDDVDGFRRNVSRKDIQRLYKVISDNGYFFGARGNAQRVSQSQEPLQAEQELSGKARAVKSNTQVQQSQSYTYFSERYHQADPNVFKVKIYGDGLGLGIAEHDRWGGAQVTWVEHNSEGWSCGVRKGDVILEVNHTDVTKKRTKFIRELLDEARPLSLRLRRPSSRGSP